MKKTILTFSLIAALSGLTASTHAQTVPGYVVVAHDDFDQNPVGANSTDGTYGRIAYNFSGAGVGNPQVTITNGTNPDTLPQDPGYTHSNYVAFTFDSTNTSPPLPLNFGWDINSLAATGNSNTSQKNYILQYDISVQGDGINNLGGFIGPINYVFGQSAAGLNWSSGEYYGNGTQTNITAGFFPAPGAGWIHVSVNMAGWPTANAGALDPTSPAFSTGFGAYMAGLTVNGREEIDIANVEILMNTNPPPVPPPTMHITKAKPGLRVFAQNHAATYNQEGFGTVDLNESWVGVATPATPVTYSFNLLDFDTVDGYTLYVQFVQNGDPGNPFGVYNGANALVWSITASSSGFTTAVNWKTNSPASGQPNNVLSLTTTSTNGRGRWSLTFTDDLDGTVTAPDGTSGSFTLPNDPNWTADFANPLIIDFGTAPNATAGYGQWITFGQIGITNVFDGTQFDDFTTDTTLNTGLWNTGFSLDNNPPSVILATTDTPYWINWTLPDDGFGLGTTASLSTGTNFLFSPAYYGSGASVANTVPTQMGTALKWTLIPKETFPTTDGTINGPVSKTGFYSLIKPPPGQ